MVGCVMRDINFKQHATDTERWSIERVQSTYYTMLDAAQNAPSLRWQGLWVEPKHDVS